MAVERTPRDFVAKRLRLNLSLRASVLGAAFGGLAVGLLARLAFARET
jgi:hypothetical protein